MNDNNQSLFNVYYICVQTKELFMHNVDYTEMYPVIHCPRVIMHVAKPTLYNMLTYIRLLNVIPI